MDKLTTIKRIFKYEISGFPIWGWVSICLLIILLRHQIANMLSVLLPLAGIITAVLWFIGQKRQATKVGIFIVYSIIIIGLF